MILRLLWAVDDLLLQSKSIEIKPVFGLFKMMQFCSLQCTIGYSSELLWNFHKQFSIPWFMTRRLEPNKHSDRKARLSGVNHRVEWPDIITFMSSEAANLNAVWMAKNKGENGVVCLQGLGKTRFPDFPKCHLMFWTTGVSKECYIYNYSQKIGSFTKFKYYLSAFENWEQTGFFWGEMVPDAKWRSIFK